MTSKWQIGIVGLIMIIVGFIGILFIAGVNLTTIDWKVVLEFITVIFSLVLIAVGAKLAMIALEE